MRRGLKTLILTGTIALVLTPIQALADGFVSPWVGSAFGSSIDNGRTTFGVNAGAMGAGIIGGEIDFGYNPSFFGTQNDFGNNTVINLMANVIAGVPVGGTHGAGIRPYITAGEACSGRRSTVGRSRTCRRRTTCSAGTPAQA